MTILHVSDLHFRKSWFDWLSDSSPQHDLLVISGDLLDLANPTYPTRQAEWVADWVRRYPRPITLCSGNHDLVWDSREDTWRAATWMQDLADEKVWVDGQHASFAGLSLYNIAAKDPVFAPADIWVVHAPPPGVSVASQWQGRDMGDSLVTDAVRAHRPFAVLCGHVHRALDWKDVYDGVLYVNPGCHENARFPNHVLLDLDQRTLVHIADYPGGPRCNVATGVGIGAASVAFS